MTRTEFENQWNQYFAGLPPLSELPMPSFDEFKISERMLEDYLDVFRGFNTRGKNLNMPYPHPFFDAKGKPLLKEKPFIKYILVGEVRLYPNAPSWNDCTPIPGDKNNTYIYDIRHVGNTPYLSSINDNWGWPEYQPCPSNKIKTLLCLASKGVLLLDLFPYSLKAFKTKKIGTELRDKLNKSNTTRSYWDSPTNSYSILNRLINIEDLLCKTWDLTLVAPCTISEFIVNPINRFPPLALVPSGLHPSQFRSIMHNASRCKKAWDWRKVAVSSAGGPTKTLIRESF